MIINNGMGSLLTVLSLFLAFVLFVDLLLTVCSQRFSLATGSLQTKLYENFGQNFILDGVIALLFLLFSFRQRSFFIQIAGFFNVGTFSKSQTSMIVGGAMVGAGLLILVTLTCFHPVFALSLMVIGFLTGTFSHEKREDFGVALLSLGAVLLGVFLLSEVLGKIGGQFYNVQLSPVLFFVLVMFTGLAFQTVIPFLALTTLFLQFQQISWTWLPFIFWVYSVISLGPFYRAFFEKRRRIYFAVQSLFLWQLLQAVSSFVLFSWFFGQASPDLFKISSFAEGLQKTIVWFALFQMTPLLFVPFYWIYFSYFHKPSEIKNKPSQKIISPFTQGRVYSLHLSLVLLRQEFLKMTTLVHTLLKLGRDVEGTRGEVAQKLEKYRGVLARVGEEIKELCFSVGKQKAYRFQIQEILSTYKTVIQLELVIEDMIFFIRFLQQKDLGEDLERECRYWLNLQLKIYEVFFNELAVPGTEVLEPVEELSEKAYEVIDRIVREIPPLQDNKYLSKALHRITDGNIALAKQTDCSLV